MSERENRREKDAPLRQDIRLLGNTLGKAIQRHEGAAVYNFVERLRNSCIRLRDYTERLNGTTPEEAFQLQQEIEILEKEVTALVNIDNLKTATNVIRAFTMYFHLVNTAEQYHRIRRRHEHELDPNNQPQHGSLEALVTFLKQNNL